MAKFKGRDHVIENFFFRGRGLDFKSSILAMEITIFNQLRHGELVK